MKPSTPPTASQPVEPGRRNSEAGDTLIEVLLALMVLALASLALIIAFSTSITASAEHRRLATADLLIENVSQQAISSIESQISLFSTCYPDTTTTVAAFQSAAPLTVPTADLTTGNTFGAVITNVAYWNSDTAQFQNTCVEDVPIQITVEVTDPLGNPYTNTFVVDYPLASSSSTSNQGPGASLVWSTQPSTLADSAIAFGTQPVLEVLNAAGQPVTSDYSPVTLSLDEGQSSGALTSCMGNELDGMVSFSGCDIALNTGLSSGTFTLIATDGQLSSVDSNPISVSGSNQPYLVFTSQPVGGNSGSAFSTEPVIKVYQGGVPVSWTGSISLSSSGGVLSGCAGLSTTTGVFSVSGCTFEGGFIYDSVSKTYEAVPYTLYASGSGVLSATSNAFTVSGAGPASQLVFSTEPSGVSSAHATTPFSTQPVVTVEDAFGNVVSTGYSTKVTMSISSPQSLSGCAGVTPSNGVAAFSSCAGSAYGTGITLSASSGSLPSTTSTTFNITGLPATLVFTTEPVAGASGSTFAVEPVITVYDTNGLIVTASTTPLSLSTSGGTLSLCTGLTPVNGVVSVTTCTFSGLVGTPYTMTATQGTITATSSDFSPTAPGKASQLLFTTEPVAGASQALLTTQPVVKVEDVAGNVVTSSSASISLTPTGGQLTSCADLGAVTGVVSVTNCVFEGLVGQQYQMTAASAGLNSALSTDFSPSGPGPASQISLSGCSPSVAWNAQCTLNGSIEDVDGNVETAFNSSVSVGEISSTGGAVTGLGATNATFGLFSENVTGSAVGDLTVEATGDGVVSNQLAMSVVGAIQTLAYYTDGTYHTVLASGTTTYAPSATYQLYAEGSADGTITYSATSPSVCSINASTGLVSILSAGTCNLAAVAGATGNYAASASTPFVLTISAATQATISVTSTSATYGTALTLTASGGSGTGAVTYAVANGTATGCLVSTSSPYTLTSTSTGTCIVTATKAASLDYLVASSAPTAVTVSAAGALTVTALNQNLPYISGPVAADSSSVSGFVGTDAATVTSATYTYRGTGSTTYGPSTTRPTAVGTYSITPSSATLTFSHGAAGDYSTPDLYVAGTLTITTAPLSIAPATQNTTYSGSAPSAATIAVTGLVGTDAATATATVTYTGTAGTSYGPSTVIPSAAGTYTMSLTNVTLHFTSGSQSNYSVTNGTGTLTIAKGTLTVTASSQNLTYNGSKVTGETSTVTGFVGSDGGSVSSDTLTYSGISGTSYGPTSTAPTNAGTYSVAPSAATINFTHGSIASYNLTYTAGTLTISAAPLTVTAANYTQFASGSTVSGDSSTLSGLVGTDSATVTAASYNYYSASSPRYNSSTPPSADGTYTVTPSSATINFTKGLLSNYSLSYATGTLTITDFTATQLTDKTSTSGVSSLTTSSFSATSGEPVLILVSYDNSSTASCVTPTSSSALTNITTLDAPTDWYRASSVSGGGGRHGGGGGTTYEYYYMCAYSATASGSSGSVTVNLGTSVDNFSIQVVGITGDTNATFNLANDEQGSGTNVNFTLGGTPSSGSGEILFGDTTDTNSNAWTAPSGFSAAGSQSSVGGDFTPVTYYGSASKNLTGSLSTSSQWGTIAIGVSP